MIQAALNGGRTRAEHSAAPDSPERLAREAAESAAAGARSIHFHARDGAGRETLSPDDVARSIEAVRAAAPGVPLGVSTGAWMVADPAERLRIIRSWHVLPDFASVNFHEDGARELAALLLERHIGVEAGALNAQAARQVIASGLAPRCLRLLIEPLEEDFSAALENLEQMEGLLARSGIGIPRLVHGAGTAAWRMLEAALARGYETRIGLEDVLTLPDGSPAPGNAALVAAAKKIAARLGRS
jgi:uncharacterized protein (DUF849 family)